MSTTEICGCEILGPDGRSDVNAAKAIAYETNLIQERGFEGLKEVSRILDPLVPVRPANVNEGESPRDFIEYRFGLGNSNVAAADDPFATGSVETPVTIQTPFGQENLTVLQKAGGSLFCDNRSVPLQAGQDVRRGVYKMLPDIESPCICVWDFARASDFGQYLQQLRTAMPSEMATMKERQLFRDMVGMSRYNTSESGADEPVFTEGYFPHEPDGGFTVSTFRKLRDRFRRQGHMGMLTIPISGPSLQAMMVSYYQAMGIQFHALNWISGNFPDSWTNDGYWVWEDIRFKSESTPIKGIMVQTATNRFDFIPISPRRWRAGTGAGVVYDYNEDYDKPVITWNGQQYNVYEAAPVVSPQAFYQQPLRMSSLPVEGVTDDGIMWNGVSIRTIGGAFISCNEKLSKFKWQLSNAFKLVPKKPYLAGFVLARSADYIRHANQIAISMGQATAAAIPWYAGQGIQPNATSCADQRAGLYPIDPAPGPMDSSCEVPGNTAGVFRTPCAGVVSENATSITLVVERINGYAGAASLAYTTADGTGVAGTDYTTTAGTLTWLDGEYGSKLITVPIPATARDGRTFLVNFSGATGAAIMTDGCTSATLTIARPAFDYALAGALTGALASMVVNGGAFSLPNAPYAATAVGAASLQDDIDDLLDGDGVANVSYSGGWFINISHTRHIFTSATAASGTVAFTQS